MNQFIGPTHQGQTIKPVAVTTPEEFWPITGLVPAHLVVRSVTRAFCGPGGSAWPDEPWWKLSGLFDLTIDQSVQAGVADLETAMADARQRRSGDLRLLARRDRRDPGEAQGSPSSTPREPKPPISTSWSAVTQSPQRRRCLPGSRASTSRSSIVSFTGAEPTDTQFDTVVITRQYDVFADFPLYPLNLVADLNAVLGGFYVHGYPFDSQPGSRSLDVAAYPQSVRRHQLLLLRD